MKKSARALVALLALAIAMAISAPVYAGGEPPAPTKCNSGGGNGSESTPETDCDPGNSGGHNNGKD